MARIQMFDVPHKALRFAFSQLLTEAGRINYTDAEALKELKEAMQTVFALVKSHSHHEDDICFAELDLLAPGATQHDREAHIRLHQTLDALISKIQYIREAAELGQDTAFAGRSLYTELCTLHAEILVHMMEEERDTQPIFWKHMTDEQIATFEPRIMASMSPEMSAKWLRYILPAQPFEVLVGMVRGMMASAPAFVVEANMQLAEEVLPAAVFERLTEEVGLAFA